MLICTLIVDEAHSQACQAETSNQGVNPPLEVACYAMQVQPVANQQVPSLLKTELAVQVALFLLFFLHSVLLFHDIFIFSFFIITNIYI